MTSYKQLLTAHIQAAAAKPLVWGSSDCATFVLDWASILSGKPWHVTPPLPQSPLAWRKRLKARDLVADMTAVLNQHGFALYGSKEKTLIGDIVLLDGEAFAICTGDRIVGRGTEGIVSMAASPRILWRHGAYL
jgi:hypothetical protein